MLEKIYLHLLILCTISYHGIIATLSDENTRESSDLLVRKRRVINHLPNGLIPVLIRETNYMVNIKKNNRFHCAGVILTHKNVITAASCLSLSLPLYQVLSGSGDSRFSNYHTVISKLTHYGNLPHEEFDGIALITVDPPFVFGKNTGNIRFHVGSLSAGAQATVTGWGCSYPIHPEPLADIRKRLRTITLPIMNHAECQAVYRGRFNITQKYLCTNDEYQYCALGDAGAPLVVNNGVAGIHIWKGKNKNVRNPDVYLNLQRADYNEWIREHTTLI